MTQIIPLTRNRPMIAELELQRTDVLNFGLLIMLKQCVFFLAFPNPKHS